jgi:TPR repeat protein
MMILGTMLIAGMGVAKSEAEGKLLIARAAKAGSHEAAALIAEGE